MKNRRLNSYLALFCMVALLVVNLIIWNNNFPYLDYGDKLWKSIFLQFSHTILNFSELILLFYFGKEVGQRRVQPVKWFVSHWLFVVIIGLLSIVFELVVFNKFTFTSLITTIFPVLRGASFIVIAMLLAPLVINYISNQSFKINKSIRIVIELIFLSGTIFGTDLWGFNNQNNVPLYLLLIVLGSLLTSSSKSYKWPFLMILVGFLLALIMPDASFVVHQNLSTANRFSLLNNGFLVVGIAELFRQRKSKLKLPNYFLNYLFSVVSLVTLPITQENLVNLLTNCAHGKISKIVFLGIVVLGSLIIGAVLTYSWKLIFEKRLSKKLPTTFNEFIEKIKALLKKQKWNLIAWTSCYVVTYISFVMVYVGFKPWFGNSVFSMILFYEQGMVIVNTIFLWLIYRMLLALTDRYWLSLLFSTASGLLWAIANRLKINARNDPIMPAEVKTYQAYGELLKMVPSWLVTTVVILIVGLIGTIFYLEKHHSVHLKQGYLCRITYVLLTIFLFGSANWWNHPNNRMAQLLVGFGNHPSFFKQLEGVQISGPLVQFLNNIDTTVMNKPSDYDEKQMEKIAKRYRKEAKAINHQRTEQLSKQTIIFNLSESFADPRRVPGIKISANPIKNIDRIKANNTSGLMLSSGYGGGTANMEYMTLTGLPVANFMPTLTVPYTQLVPFMQKAWSFNQLFNSSIAIHPYVGTFYSRISVYKKFGFNKFMYLGSKYKIKHQRRLDQS